MAPGAVVRDLAVLQKLHQVGSGDVDEVGCLLGGQLGVDRHHGDGVALGGLSEQLQQVLEHALSKDHLDLLVAAVSRDTHHLLRPKARQRSERVTGCVLLGGGRQVFFSYRAHADESGRPAE